MKKKKTAYLHNNSGPFRILPMEMTELVTYYKKKKITIYMNGTTSLGMAFIHENKKKFARQTGYKDIVYRDIKYAVYLQYHSIAGVQEDSIAGMQEDFARLKDALAEFLDLEALNENSQSASHRIQLRKNIDFAQLQQIDTICAASTLARDIGDNSQIYRQDLINEYNNIGISKQQAMWEIQEIRKVLAENEKAGYVCTFGNRISNTHTEVIIITKKAVIKPVEWAPYQGDEINCINSDDFDQLYKVEIPLINSHAVIIPQGGAIGCGTLGFKYLKELLKNNARQLDEYSLYFNYYKEEKLSYVFIPSPQVLRYSQSAFFNELIKALFSTKEQIVLYHSYRNRKYTVKTIQTMLMETIAWAEIKSKTELINESKALLACLPSFREKWLKEYKNIKLQRQAMDDKQGVNRYLAYATHCYKQLVTKPVKPVTNTETADGIIKLIKYAITEFISEQKLKKRPQRFFESLLLGDECIMAQVYRDLLHDRKPLLSQLIIVFALLSNPYKKQLQHYVLNYFPEEDSQFIEQVRYLLVEEASYVNGRCCGDTIQSLLDNLDKCIKEIINASSGNKIPAEWASDWEAEMQKKALAKITAKTLILPVSSAMG